MTRFKFSNFQNISKPIIDSMGIRYKTVEHAYQAAKTLNRDERVKVANCATPAQAKKMGKVITLREDWDILKDSVMLWCLRHKFTKCPEHQESLLSHTKEIVELNYWHDNYWGSCTCKRCGGRGQNKLGKMIQSIKEEM